MSTFYTVLGVSEQATAAEIRQAYRRLVLLTHPDRTPDPAAHRRYIAINEAYETLSSAARRQQYDARLRQPTVSPVAAPVPAAAPVHRDPALRRRGRPAARRRPTSVHAQYAQRTYDLRPYIRPVFYVGRTLLAGALLLVLDFFLLRYHTTADFLAVAEPNQVDALYYITTTHGQFATRMEVPLNTEGFRVYTSLLLPFVHAAWLPNGQEVPVVQQVTSLNSFTGLLIVLALLSQWPRLPMIARINCLLGAIIVGVIVLLMALQL
ncbi:J domain-containing protein [Microvirga sp. STR05]|uniref:J domain-containing protein n=1 Tax=Hymenobacter duratus TaxID=2771356 RepID=A0ABR8JBW7_9BACT|nr:J domain-containing protein [Hymenobacter duratus]MBD2714244.1 J domain-containing protein [Hymenobacter duratus]MBR7949146.1 J domain-containing protein [Microvirga sp. STR05]